MPPLRLILAQGSRPKNGHCYNECAHIHQTSPDSIASLFLCPEFSGALFALIKHDEIMPNVIVRPGWYLPERLATPESAYRNRRHFLKELGFLGGATAMAGLNAAESAAKKGYPYPRNVEFAGKNL